MNKLIKSLLAATLGAAVSLSSVGVATATPLQQACASFAQACQDGDQFACERYIRSCRP